MISLADVIGICPNYYFLYKNQNKTCFFQPVLPKKPPSTCNLLKNVIKNRMLVQLNRAQCHDFTHHRPMLRLVAAAKTIEILELIQVFLFSKSQKILMPVLSQGSFEKIQFHREKKTENTM